MNIPVESVYYYVTNERYKGKMPGIYSANQIPDAAGILKEHYTEIKNEIENHFSIDFKKVQPSFICHDYSGKGWGAIPLYGFCRKSFKNCNKFPITTAVVESIPGMTSAEFSILAPGTKLKPHIDHTNAVMTLHLGIRIPGTLPELGFRTSNEEIGWKEGEVIAVNAAKPHTAWNLTTDYRIILIVDVIHDQFKDRKLMICGNVLAGLVMKYIASRYSALKKIPKTITILLHRMLGLIACFVLILQRALKI